MLILVFYHRISQFGCPSRITTDRGQQFESSLWTELMKLLGSHRIITTASHLQANGLLERFHHQLKDALRAHRGSYWVDILPVVLLGIRTSVKHDIGCSAELSWFTTLLCEFRVNFSLSPMIAQVIPPVCCTPLHCHATALPSSYSCSARL